MLPIFYEQDTNNNHTFEFDTYPRSTRVSTPVKWHMAYAIASIDGRSLPHMESTRVDMSTSVMVRFFRICRATPYRAMVSAFNSIEA